MGIGIIQTNVEKLSATLRGISKLTQEYKETKAPETKLTPVIPGVYREIKTGPVTERKVKAAAKKVLGAGARGLMKEYIQELPQEKTTQQILTLAKRGGATPGLITTFKKQQTGENLQEIYNLQQYYTYKLDEATQGAIYPEGITIGLPSFELPSFLPKIDWKIVGLAVLGLAGLYAVSKGAKK